MKFAERLLAAFGVDEALQGDLVEEGAGRGIAWLVWQTASAITVHVGSDLRRHPVLALRAIAMGWGLMAWAPVLRWFQPHHTGWAFVFAFAVLVWPAIVGRIIARTHRAQHAAMVLAYVASAALWCGGYYVVHLAEVPRMYAGMSLTCVSLLSTLAGGLVKTRRGAEGLT